VAGFCKYINENYSRIPIFFALTVSEHYTKTLKDDLFIVGLAYQYSRERIDNLALLKKNFEKKISAGLLE
ncbi:MAG: hypothetical protein ACE5GL_03555, partial [Calditrichia bacterium]